MYEARRSRSRPPPHRRRADDAGSASRAASRPPRRATPPPAPRAAGRGRGPGTGRPPARRAASRRRPNRPRPPARRPPPPCAARSSARPARGPRGNRGAAGERSRRAGRAPPRPPLGLRLLRGGRLWLRRLRLLPLRGLLAARGAAGGGARVRLLLGGVVALGHPEVVRAVRLVLVLLAEVLDEGVERLLLVLGLEEVADRVRGLLERLLRGRRDLRYLEDIEAELGLQGALQLVLLGTEDRLVERLLLLALGDVGELAALRLGGVVDRVPLGDRLEAVASPDRGLGLGGLGLGLGDHHVQVAPFRLCEALPVLLVVVLDVGVGDLALALGDLLRELRLELVELDAKEDVLLGHAGGLEVALVGLLGRERLLLLVLERLPHLRVGHPDVARLGLLLDPLRLDEELHDVALQLVVLLLALLLERVGARLLAAGRQRLPSQPRHTALEVGRVGHGPPAALGLCESGVMEPPVELRLGDDRVADLGDAVRGNVVPAPERGEAAEAGDGGDAGELDGVLHAKESV